jgi:hypothetical protein
MKIIELHKYDRMPAGPLSDSALPASLRFDGFYAPSVARMPKAVAQPFWRAWLGDRS